MATLLLELFSEEIPSRMQRNAAEQLQRAMLAGLEKNLLKPSSVKTFASPRHLAIQCFGLPAVQPDVREERKGPKVGAPEQAMKGFLGATGLTVEQCEQRDGYYYATIERKGQPTADVVKKIVEEALTAFSWPKSMRWGARPLQWVRPLHRIVCLLDEAVVPVTFAHLSADRVTQGHRFLSPDTITLAHAEKYEDALKSAHVVVDYAARRAQIAEGIAALAAEANLQVVADDALLDEVTGLVEWPVPLLGEFDAKFLDLPPEVLISEMKVHQRYFALQDASGTLTNKFIAVANMVTEDGGKRVIAGNARVLRARLSDGEFYWAQDRKTPLAAWGEKLRDVVFHAKVGMMDAKVGRIEKLAVSIAQAVGFQDEQQVRQAARLCKADLTSGMVGEFPELQGIMGRYYANAQGENEAVAEAIYEHYKPQGAGDSLPETALGAIISVADKLDSIVSLFAAGEKPTGSKDPLALRRAALGVLRIVLDRQWSLNVTELAGYSYPSENPILVSGQDPKQQIEADIRKGRVAMEVADFFRDRLQNLLREEGLSHDVIEATLTSQARFNALALANDARALAVWLASASGKETLAAIKRVLNILAAEEKKAKTTFASDAVLNGSLGGEQEKALWAAVQRVAHTKVEMLEELTAPINAFFEAVLVTEEQFREARLSLLAAVRAAALNIADFSKIEG